ncbi:hypothetical protein QBC37DRAFT_396100 [Rhypophila decipiens]|uniref:Uncharacterized protein n=1 Tax=Rhypophila decipiens TaxID=261697 RepID=A0AAN7BBX1_9PEZI|nr:hypothetical protein QBC37DRAFT_396100 [Rhypophila decipiens]
MGGRRVVRGRRRRGQCQATRWHTITLECMWWRDVGTDSTQHWCTTLRFEPVGCGFQLVRPQWHSGCRIRTLYRTPFNEGNYVGTAAMHLPVSCRQMCIPAHYEDKHQFDKNPTYSPSMEVPLTLTADGSTEDLLCAAVDVSGLPPPLKSALPALILPKSEESSEHPVHPAAGGSAMNIGTVPSTVTIERCGDQDEGIPVKALKPTLQDDKLKTLRTLNDNDIHGARRIQFWVNPCANAMLRVFLWMAMCTVNPAHNDQLRPGFLIGMPRLSENTSLDVTISWSAGFITEIATEVRHVG